MTQPLVSVLMAVHNAERYVREAVDSILNQTFCDFEFIIIDDASSDGTAMILKAFKDSRIKLISHKENRGLTKSLNVGLAEACGVYIARQDADDVSTPARLQKEVDFLNSHSDVALVGTFATFIDAEGHRKIRQKKFPTDDLALKWGLMFNNQFVHTSVMFRRDAVWDALGGYDESCHRAQDYELWSRMARDYAVSNIPESLVLNRQHAQSLVGRDPSENIQTALGITAGNMKYFLQREDVPADWPMMTQQIALGPVDGRVVFPLKACVDLLDMLYGEFCSRYPAAKENQQIRVHRACQLARAAYHMGPTDPGLSLKTYGRAMRLSRQVIWQVPLPYYLYFLVSGGRIKRRKF